MFPNIHLRMNCTDIYEAKEKLSKVRWNERSALIVGNILIKAEGVASISLLREVWPEAFIVVDLRAEKTEEAELASIGGADGATISANTRPEEIDGFIGLCHKKDILVYLLSEAWPHRLLNVLKKRPDVVVVREGPFVRGGPKVGLMADDIWDGCKPLEEVDIYIVEKKVWESEKPDLVLKRLMEVVMRG